MAGHSHAANVKHRKNAVDAKRAKIFSKLARHIIYDLSEYYEYYKQTEFTWNKIKQNNRNPLLYMNIGADGLKTGYTREAGYGLVASAVRDGRRLIMVIAGMKSFFNSTSSCGPSRID